MKPLVNFLVLLFSIALVHCIPSWNSPLYAVRPQASIGSLVPGASFVQALGPKSNINKDLFLSTNSPKGMPGSALIYENPNPPLFYVYKDQLWQLTNETYILRVNLMNVTDDANHPAPLRLELDTDPKGIKGGEWRWKGTALYYDLGNESNNGLFFSCRRGHGYLGVYTSLQPMAAPEQCEFVTFHSFVERTER